MIVLDEVQRRPEIFPTLRTLIDRTPARRFLVLGCAAPELLQQSSESLAGRIAYGGEHSFALGPSVDAIAALDVTTRLPGI
jgi:predicted AAA+ superfamily ATPase